MTNCSDSMKRRNERRERRKRQTRRLFLLALITGLVAGFFLGRVSAQAVEKPEPTVEPIETVAGVIPEPPMFISVEETQPVEPDPEPEPEWITYRITAYCSCEICCGEWAKNRPNGIVYGAAGVELKQGVSCASPLPLGTVVEIDGLGTYVVQDRIAQWVVDRYGEALIDIYFNDHEAAKAFGLKYLNVYVKGDTQNDPV